MVELLLVISIIVLCSIAFSVGANHSSLTGDPTTDAPLPWENE